MNHVLGIESDPSTNQTRDEMHVAQVIDLPQHVRMTAVTLQDRSDACNELVHRRHWLLHPSEIVEARGNLFVFENILDQSGIIVIKQAALPEWRAVPSDWDVRVEANKPTGFRVCLHDDQTYPWHVLRYEGGVLGRTQVLHQFQRQFRPLTDIRFLSNTWGDRSRDARLCEAFVLQEIDAAQRLGVEVVQLDDGWQQGRSMNSIDAKTAQGRWEGFHDGASDFWLPDPVRFPNGLEPVIKAAKSHGVEIGLWYAPDSADDFAHWQEDVQTVMHLCQQYDVRHFKFDSINVRSRQGEVNLHRMLDAIQEQSSRRIVIDLDITAASRPGYFGRMDCGPLFVANRYTDNHWYWPHQTFRMLWQLAHWIDPIRLRLMLLNRNRNTLKYPDDPLAPACITSTSIFAPLMFCQPLAWCELCNLPEHDLAELDPLVALWKEHRQAIHANTILPIGHEPDGVRWSGLMSLNIQDMTGYLLVCNHQQEHINLTEGLPDGMRLLNTMKLAGDGQIDSVASIQSLDMLHQQSFWFGSITLSQHV